MQRPIIKGDLWTLVRISFPLFLFLFCESLTTFWERIFLSYHGTEGVAIALSAADLAFVFHGPCVAIASMGQVFVGYYQGSGELKRIGSCVWQLIWFSLLSLIITLPLGFWSSSFYFKGTVIEDTGPQYFNILVLGNFLFPLTTALASFYLGRGRTLLVTLCLIAGYVFNLILCWILVFGIKGFIPSQGIRGGALAKCFSMGLLALIFFAFFLNRKNRQIYGTGSFMLSISALWFYVRPGTMRAFFYLWVRFSWAVISYMIIKKGDLYLDVLAIGGTVIGFFVFIYRGTYQAILTVASNLLGAKKYGEIWKLSRTLILYTSILGIILAIPLLLYPQLLTHFFDSASREIFEKTFKMINHWVWLYLVLLIMQMGLFGIVMAKQDLKMQLCASLITTLTSLFPVYLATQVLNWQPDKLWMIMALENAIFGWIFFYRLNQKKMEEMRPVLD